VGKEGNEYLINDPLSGGDETRYLSYYGEQVYALRIFEKETGQ
jgi:hypothetical protein